MEQKYRIDRDALFCDETPQFRTPYEAEAGDEVIFRFRVKAGSALSVKLIAGDRQFEMRRAYTAGLFDWYETPVCPGADIFYYYFEINTAETDDAAAADEVSLEGCVTDEGETLPEHDRCYYLRTGVSETDEWNCETAFRMIPGFHTPAWAKGAVMYQIFTERFRNGDPGNDVLDGEYYYWEHRAEKRDWDALPTHEDVYAFWGGDLAGVLEKLDYLKHLGVEVLYFNPLFVSPSNHKYDTQDYDHIDPHFTGFVRDCGEVLPEGSTDNRLATRYESRTTDPENLRYANEFFAKFVEAAHEKGFKIILDGVFNHCGSFNKWMNGEGFYRAADGYLPGAADAADSPYHDYFYFKENSVWPEHVDYLGWWNYRTLPKMNYESSPALHDEILRIAAKWLKGPYHVDGWRLDVAADLGGTEEYNHAFWQDFRKTVKKENPEALILAEHYGNPEKWLRGNEWDTVMNYDAFMDPVGYFLTGLEKHSDEYERTLHGNGEAFFESMRTRMCRLPGPSLLAAMNELSNHDHARFLTRTNRTTGRLETRGNEAASEGVSYATFREGVVMQFTLPGAPTIYYGDETGVCGWTDPDSRRTYPWGKEKWELIAFHRDTAAIHKRYECLKTGAYKPLTAGFGYIAYGRFDENNSVLTVINHSEKDRVITVPVWQIGMPENGRIHRILQTNDAGYNVGVKPYEVKDGMLLCTVPAWSGTVFAAELV